MSIQKQLIDQDTGIPFVDSGTFRKALDTKLEVMGIKIFHNAGSLGGGSSGSYVPNSAIGWLRVYNGKNITHDYVGDQESGKVPRLIQILREKTRWRQKANATAEMITIMFPTPQKLHSIVVEGAFNSIAKINDGDRTTYTGATLDIQAIVPKKPYLGRVKRIQENGGKIIYGTKTGGALSEYINPTLSGHLARSLTLLLEDDGTESNSAIDKISLFQGDKKLFEGSIPKLQEIALENFNIAPNTGFVYMSLGDVPIGQSDLRLVAAKSVAGTDVDLHWIITSVKMA